jgi:hypothetical protein
MKKKFLYFTIIFFIIFSPGCARVEGLRDKSFTVSTINASIEGPIAILPIKEIGSMPGLAEMVETSLNNQLKATLPNSNVIDVDTFKSRIVDSKLEGKYGQWKSAYDSSKMISFQPVGDFSNAVSARYFLLVPSVHLGRERIRAVDSGYSGWVNDTYNVWRTDLKILAEVLDTKERKVIWKGVGHAENINSPHRDIDLFLVIFHDKNPEMQEYLQAMINQATKGIAENLIYPNKK